MSIQFWSNNPTILLNKDNIFEIWPSPCMSFESKLNAISRLVILLTALGFLVTQSARILIIGFITLAAIFFLYKFRKQKLIKSLVNKEGFINVAADYSGNSPAPIDVSVSTGNTTNVPLGSVLQTDYYASTKRNPMGNVLLTEISDNPLRKAAPPSFNPIVNESINKNTKKSIQMLNPGIKNTSKQLFGDLGQNFELDQSLLPFYSMPNTKIPNDQTAFADFLYGNMPSCRDGSAFACVQDNERYIMI
jgi:hypothetical protein